MLLGAIFFCRPISQLECNLRTATAQWLPVSTAHIISHPYCTGTIPPPPVEGEAKIYPEKIQNLVDDISKLTLIEVADLNELLKVCIVLIYSATH